MENAVKVSVLIPVYNTFHTLGRCLDSVLKQTLQEIEIICVDDGSDPPTKEVLETYRQKDPRMKVLTLDRNYGILYARREAIMESCGDYIMFLDSDDEYVSNACEIAYKKIRKKRADILQFGTEIICDPYADKQKCYYVQDFINVHRGKLKDRAILKECFGLEKRDTKYNWNLWDKIFRKEILKRVVAYVPADRCSIAEDFMIYFMSTFYAKRFYGIKKRLIRYYFGAGISSNLSGANVKVYQNMLGNKLACDTISKFLKIERTSGTIYNEINEKWEQKTFADLIWKLICQCPVDIGAEVFDLLCDSYTATRVINEIVKTYGRNCFLKLAKMVYGAKCLQPKEGPVRTIGIFYHRFYNGGVERVISLLVPRFMQWGYKVVLFVEQEHPDDYALPEGCKKVVVPASRYIPAKRYERHFKALHEELVANHIDLFLHQASSSAWLLPDLLLAKSLGIKVAVTMHELLANPLLRDKKAYPVKPYILRLADGVQTIVKSDEAYLRQFKVNARYLPNPFTYTVQSETKEGSGKKILWIGRLESLQKRPEQAIEIMAKVVQAVPDAKLYLVGKSEYEDEDKRLRSVVAAKGLQNNVIMCGYCNDPIKYFQECDILLMTSFFEVWGMVLCEAMSYGMPIVCYNIPYLETLRDNEGCAIVPQCDTNGAAREIIRIMQDDTLRATMSIRSKEMAQKLKDFNLETGWKQFIDGLSISPAECDPNLCICLENILDFYGYVKNDPSEQKKQGMWRVTWEYWKKYGLIATVKQVKRYVKRYGLREK